MLGCDTPLRSVAGSCSRGAEGSVEAGVSRGAMAVEREGGAGNGDATDGGASKSPTGGPDTASPAVAESSWSSSVLTRKTAFRRSDTFESNRAPLSVTHPPAFPNRSTALGLCLRIPLSAYMALLLTSPSELPPRSSRIGPSGS